MPTPSYYDGTVYIATGDKHLYGIDPDTGKEIWSLNLGSVVSMSAPNIEEDILYVGGSSPYVFFAVDLDAKEIKWKTHFEKVTSGLDDVPPVISDDGVVYTTGVKDTSKPLSVKEIYNQEGLLPAYKQSIKKVIGNIIDKLPRKHYDHTIFAMDSDSGDVKWEQSLGIGKMVSNNKSGAPMLYNQEVFVGSPITKSFYAFDAKTGEELWCY